MKYDSNMMQKASQLIYPGMSAEYLKVFWSDEALSSVFAPVTIGDGSRKNLIISEVTKDTIIIQHPSGSILKYKIVIDELGFFLAWNPNPRNEGTNTVGYQLIMPYSKKFFRHIQEKIKIDVKYADRIGKELKEIIEFFPGIGVEYKDAEESFSKSQSELNRFKKTSSYLTTAGRRRRSRRNRRR